MRATLTAHGRAALQGMPGVGKTQLALKYAERHRQDYAACLWVSAASRETWLSGFAALAGVLNLPERNEADQEKAVTAVQRWLDTTEQTWLLILDNADELELLQGFLPSGRGHCLLTTYAQGVRALATPESVEKMKPADGARLLLRRAGRLREEHPFESVAPAEREAATALATELDGLPLALDQAGAYVEETGDSLAEYRKLYQTEGKRLRAERGDIPLDHVSVTITFNLAFAQVAQRNPSAVELLRACAFLHPDAIPEELLIEGAPEWGKLLAAVLPNLGMRPQLFKVLNHFSLIARDTNAKTLTLHRVVQAVLQDELNEASQRRWAKRAVRAVNYCFPHVEFSHWPQCERLLPQVQAAAVKIESWNFAFPEGACLLNNAACYLHERGRYAEAEPLLRRALTIREYTLGFDHLDVATSLNNLALLYRAQGRYAKAEPLLRRALTILERALGPDHPDVATSLNSLALLYYDQGRYAKAEPLYKRALTIRERDLGHAHPHVALSCNNLAALYHAQGRFAEVEPLYQRARDILEHALGPGHPDVALSLNNLAALYDDQGRWAEAEPLYQRALAIRERALGPDHPDVAAGLENYAVLLEQTGRAAEAATLRERAQAIRERHAQANSRP